jgi:D-glucosaminate-6-phosphate ammonia-lyase
MSIYERYGVQPIINAVGPWTAYGGASLKQIVLDAMNRAAREDVRLDHLQASASKIISRLTHSEAGLVTAGASAALTLGTAACIAGLDIAKMNRLPDTLGMANEVIKPWHQITSYDHAVRAAGAKIVGAGLARAFTSAHEQHKIGTWEIEAKITEKTAAIAYTIEEGNCPPLEEVTRMAMKYKIPVLVDAAPKVPPPENLYRFVDMGADLVCFSGGKGICGPQASGILCGRRDLVASAALQMLDFHGPFETWDPPLSLIPKDKLRGIPERGLGRSMKVSKEAIVGLLAALDEIAGRGFPERVERLGRLLQIIISHIEGICGVEVEITGRDQKTDPKLEVKIKEDIVGKSAAKISRNLREDAPAIYVGEMYLEKGIIYVNALNLSEESANLVGRRLHAAITG